MRLRNELSLLKKHIKTIPIEDAIKYITLQHGNSQGPANHTDKCCSFQITLSEVQLLCIYVCLTLPRKI